MSRVAPLLFGLVCVLGLGLAGFDLRMAARHASSSLEPAATVSAEPARAVLADFGNLVEWPLFGGSGATAGAIAPLPNDTSSGELPASTAPYRLFGIIASAGTAPRRAILGTDESSQRAYREGDAAPDGATVQRIDARAVILIRDGQAEILKLPGDFSTAGEAAPLPGENAVVEDVQISEPLPETASPDAVPPAPPPVNAAAPIERLRQRIEAARAAAARGEGPAPIFAPPGQ